MKSPVSVRPRPDVEFRLESPARRSEKLTLHRFAQAMWAERLGLSACL